MSLRAKLLLPLLLIGVLMGVFLFGRWIPASLANNEAEHLKMVNQHLDSVVEGVIPLLLGNQLDIIHENLNALKNNNPAWIDIRLVDAEGRQLYPLASVPAPPQGSPSPDRRTLKKHIAYLKMGLGILSVQVDLAPALENARRENRALALMIFYMLAILLAATVLLAEFAVRRPVRQLADASKRLARQDFDTPLPPVGRDEVGDLVASFAAMRDSLRDYHADLLHEIAERREAEEALRKLNATLEQRVGEELARNREKDHMLIQQSRLAAMGEMVHNIAHQWRQPLNSLGLTVSNMQDDFRFNTMTPESMARDVEHVRRLLERMSTTIDDFRDFFRPDREETQFDVADAAKQAVFVIEATLKNNHIDLVVDTQPGLSVTGFHGQYAQAVLNLLVNAKEAILERKAGNGQIRLALEEREGNAVLTVDDNGGGIPEAVLPRLFDPYFTTKEQGSGIGLYMVKMIIERNMHGTVAAANIEDGARFTLCVPLGKEK